MEKKQQSVGDGLDGAEEEQAPLKMKVVLIGGTSVGKTSIFNRVINEDYIEENVTTLTAYYRPKMITVPGHDRKLQINLWDTAGQEKFMSLTKQYILNAQGVVLVYDTTMSDSLGEAE